jgi:hypothetical protein
LTNGVPQEDQETGSKQMKEEEEEGKTRCHRERITGMARVGRLPGE